MGLFMVQIAYSAAFGGAIWIALRLLAKADNGMLLKHQDALGSSIAEAFGRGITNPGFVGVVASLVCLLVVRAISAIQDGIATAILYCYMSREQLGGTPKAFHSLVLTIDPHAKVKED